MIKLLQKQNGAVFYASQCISPQTVNILVCLTDCMKNTQKLSFIADYLKSPNLSFDCFKRQLKTFLFCVYQAVLCYFSVLETFVERIFLSDLTNKM